MLARIQMRPIGFVRSGFTREGPKQHRKEILADIIVNDTFTTGLDGLDDYSHLFVLFWMHQVPRGARRELRVHPRGRMDLPLTGIFATRAPNHPNPIGLAVVELLKRDGNILHVRALDAYDGTPVLDIKPYDPDDFVENPRLPAWWRQLRQEDTQHRAHEQ